MKHSAKRAVSLLLTVPIILSAFAFTSGVSAAEKEIDLDSYAAAGGEYLSVNERFESAEGMLNLIMAGLKPENKEMLLNALSKNLSLGSDSLKLVDNAIPDAEKWNSEPSWGENFTDSGLCWAASASNMLWISGWAQRFTNPATGQSFSSEDDVFAYYTKKFTDKGADVDRGIDWFFMGEFFINGTGSHANPRDFYDPQDGVMKEFVSSYAQKKYDLAKDPASIGALERLDRSRSDAAVFQASIGSLYDGELYRSEHSVTVAGIVTDPSAAELSGRYKAIAIIDSDNDASPSEEAQKIVDPTDEQKLRDKMARPNSVTLYPLRLNTDAGGKVFWEIVGYSDFETEALYALNALSLPDDSIVERYTETEGNHSVADTVDLTIDTAFITDSGEPVTDIWAYEHMELPRRNYVSGDAVSVNYFVSNRSSVMLDEEYTGGGQLKIVYQVSRDEDGKVVIEGEDIFTLPLYPRAEMGQMIRLNGHPWDAGDYTVRLTLNPDRAVREAYYLNNTDFYCHFTVIEELLGDANLDGDVDVTDAAAIQRYDAEMIWLNDTALTLADADRDGETTIIDATFIQRYAAGMKAPEGIGEPIKAEPASL